MSEGKTRGKTSGLMEDTEVVPNDVGISVMNMGKLQGGNMKDDFSTGEFLLLEKNLDRLGVGTS
jgi:hypothetical protein